MMYNNKLAVAIKSAGNVLREFKDEVYVPFGAEYSIYIKNLNGVRALVTVSVDGEDVGDGTQFVINANDTVELERFIKNGNLSKGNRFKFIERTSAVEEHRGVRLEDGLVRVEFSFEKPAPVINVNPYPWWNEPWNDKPWRPYKDPYTITYGNTGKLRSFVGANHVSTNVSNEVKASADVGITVPGSISDQQFNTVSSFVTEDETHVIVLKMLGQTEDNVRVRKPVTVKAKPKCSTCGLTNKATAKFCTECGTSLQIV